MNRVVVDVNVLMSALISPDGVAAQIVRHTASRSFDLMMSPQLLHELTTVTSP